MKRQAKIELFLSDARGIYIPRDFARAIDKEAIDAKFHDGIDVLANDDDATGQSYWDTWYDILDNAVITAMDGKQYTVFQDGDCWLIEKGAEYDEFSDWDLGYYIDNGEDDLEKTHPVITLEGDSK